ncbi:LytR/AlgR family response regulator transcription factor [Ferruginibacter sp.]
MIKVIAVDDEPLALDIIETYCKQFDFLVFEKGFTRTGTALQYLEKNPVDLLLLDINMPAMSGMEFYRSLNHKPMLIFTTSYSEYAIESYDLGALDYLLKPFTSERFGKAVQRAYENFNLMQNSGTAEKIKSLMLKADYGLIKVVLADILFIEGLDNYLKIHLHNQSPVVVRLTMKSLMEKLSSNEFIRVHRSYIVPLHRIEAVRNKTIYIGNEEIPIGSSYEEYFNAHFKK